MRKQKPLLLLDVDGVLCPFGITDPAYPPEGYSFCDVGGFGLWISKGNSAYLKTLANSFELVWATMWEEGANKIIGPLHDLDVLPYVGFHEYLTRSVKDGTHAWDTHYKLGAIDEFVDERPFAWIDDDIDQSVLEWATSRTAPTLVLPVQSDQGLNREIVQKLIDFASSLTQEGADSVDNKRLRGE